MCGIVGILDQSKDASQKEENIRRMLGMIRHRGPDQFGIYVDDQVGLGSARLSIIDLTSGQQPITNEDRSLWIVFNGEIFNYIELRPDLERRGHRFSTQSDTEVILHLYEEYGPGCLNLLNGQFAFAIWNANDQSLFLARDRVGIRPLFYTHVNGSMIFGSEIKAILSEGQIQPEIDSVALDQIFTFWSPLSPRTAFKDIFEVPAGHFLLSQDGRVRIERYWQLNFPEATRQPTQHKTRRNIDSYLEEFRDLLIDATQIRLRADVPVGAYLSGGIDSSTITAIIRNFTGNQLDTFSISFSDPDFDESDFQRRMANYLGTDHQVVYATHADIGRIFPEIIWHTEIPITRTAPAPMYLLSKLVHEHNYKVVLTGEGADEFLGGYDIFKEAKIRRFWAKMPESKMRPSLLRRIHPYLGDLTGSAGSYLEAFFREGITDVDNPEYSHAPRWKTTSRTKRFFSEELKQATQPSRIADALDIYYPSQFYRWDPLAQAQYLEISIFLSQYLLSSQGDRMGMANSVEGRFPFLDYRVIEFSNQLPPEYKLFGLNEKYILRQLAREWLPNEIWQRTKKPYRAPIHRSFFNDATQDYVYELLSPLNINEAGFFNANAVKSLVEKIERGARFGETDDMALAGILSTQLLHHQFISQFQMAEPIASSDDIKVHSRKSEISGRENVT